VINTISALLLSIGIFTASDAISPQKDSYRHKLQSVRDSLQDEVADRWQLRETINKKREFDKEDFAQLSDTLENYMSELSIIKEQIYQRERKLEQLQQKYKSGVEELQAVNASVDEILKMEMKSVTQEFPLDVSINLEKIESIRQKFSKKSDLQIKLNSLKEYYLTNVKTASRIQIVSGDILPDSGFSVHMNIIRFGNVFGYGVTSDGNFFSVNRNGRNEKNPYTVTAVSNENLQNSLTENFRNWIDSASQKKQLIPLDVLQNEHSKVLLSNASSSWFSRVKEIFYAGGPVMVPLCLLSLWALILIVIKYLQLTVKYLSDLNICRKVNRALKENGLEALIDNTSKRKGAIFAIVSECLNQNSGRKNAEDSIKVLILKELIRQNSYLDTLAIIAAIAPLLGLLGTVTGMIDLFDVITKFGTGDPKLLSKGISEALVTTEAGLIIAIPVLLIHNHLKSLKSKINNNLQVQAMILLNRYFPES